MNLLTKLVFKSLLARNAIAAVFVPADTSLDCGHRCTDLRSIAGNQRTDYSSSESICGYTCLVYPWLACACTNIQRRI